MNGDHVVPIEIARSYSTATHGRNVLRRSSTRHGGQEVIEIVRSHTGSPSRRTMTHYSNSAAGHSRHSRSQSHRRSSSSGRGGFWARIFGLTPTSTKYHNRPRSSTPSRHGRRRSSTPFLHPHRRTRPIEYGVGTFLRGFFTRNLALREQGKLMMREAKKERRRERRRRLRRLKEEGLAIRMGDLASRTEGE